MLARLIRVLHLLAVLVGGHRALAIENLALRPQLAMYQRTRPRPAVRFDAAGAFDSLHERPEVLRQVLERPHLVPEPNLVDLVGLAVAAREVPFNDLDAGDGARQSYPESSRASSSRGR